MNDMKEREQISARVPLGTSARISEFLRGGEMVAGFIRTAVEKEIAAREKEIAKNGRLAPSAR